MHSYCEQDVTPYCYPDHVYNFAWEKEKLKVLSESCKNKFDKIKKHL